MSRGAGSWRPSVGVGGMVGRAYQSRVAGHATARDFDSLTRCQACFEEGVGQEAGVLSAVEVDGGIGGDDLQLRAGGGLSAGGGGGGGGAAGGVRGVDAARDGAADHEPEQAVRGVPGGGGAGGGGGAAGGGGAGARGGGAGVAAAGAGQGAAGQSGVDAGGAAAASRRDEPADQRALLAGVARGHRGAVAGAGAVPGGARRGGEGAGWGGSAEVDAAGITSLGE